MEKIKANRFYQLERTVKGFANHRRIQVLELLNKQPELSVGEITEELKVSFKTASEHIRRLAIAGLVIKRSDGLNIRHRLTDKGKTILIFLRTLE